MFAVGLVATVYRWFVGISHSDVCVCECVNGDVDKSAQNERVRSALTCVCARARAYFTDSLFLPWLLLFFDRRGDKGGVRSFCSNL